MDFLGQEGQDQQGQYEDSSQGYPQQMPMMGMPRRFDSDFLKYQYDVNDVLDQMEQWLRGNVKNNDGVWENRFKPMIAQEGINLLMGDLRSHLHKGVFLSNLSMDQVQRMALETRLMVVCWIYRSWYKYNIDKSNMDRIVTDIDHCILCALMKPLNDKERIHLGETTSRSENINVVSEPQRKRFGIF